MAKILPGFGTIYSPKEEEQEQELLPSMKLFWHQEALLSRQQMENLICAIESAGAIGLAGGVLFLPALQQH